MPIEFITAKIENRSVFKKFRTITISFKKGISAVYGLLNDESDWKIQSYKFSIKKGWTVDKAYKWAKINSTNVLTIMGKAHIIMCGGKINGK